MNKLAAAQVMDALFDHGCSTSGAERIRKILGEECGAPVAGGGVELIPVLSPDQVIDALLHGPRMCAQAIRDSEAASTRLADEGRDT